MQVDLVFPTPEVVRDYYRGLIYLAARTCYTEKSPQEIWERYRSGKVTPEELLRVVNHVIESGHHSTIEHINFTFAISGVSRALSHQLVRHRIGVAFDQQSQRYVKFKSPSLVEPPSIAADEALQKQFDEVIEAGERAYQSLLDLGAPAEDARFILPNATTTNLIMTVNLRELIHMAGLRLCVLAQWEIRQLFKLIRKELLAVDDFFGNMMVPKCVPLGSCDEKRNEDGHCRIRPHKTLVLQVFQDYKAGRLQYVNDSAAVEMQQSQETDLTPGKQ
jgi:thymidylate synthase (FAD)